MKISEQVSLLLTGAMALTSWAPSWAAENPAKPQGPTIPVHEVPAAGWPEAPKAPAGAPNVVVILIDDVGFGATSAFGGPINTPNFERLANAGLRYNSFHMNALCSPTRAALLTGRNNHQVGFGSIAEWSAPYPGYNTVIPKSAATIAEVLKENGYSTSVYGKWHNTPLWEVSAAGPFDHWPTGLGFEHFYGFNQAADNQYYPRIYNDTTPVEPAKTPQEGYHFTTDIADNAIQWLHQHDAVAHDKPFFVYFATGATHEPHQVAKQWVDHYRGRFDRGWDAIRKEAFEKQKAQGLIPANAEFTPRPDGLPAWNSLSEDQKKLLAHQAEVYAGFTEQTDYEVGRVLDAIREEGQENNTVVFWIFGDNGASAEGGLDGRDSREITGKPKTIEERLDVAELLGSELYMNHYAASWAWALNSPFVGTKQDAGHLGGTTDPLVVYWPGHVKPGLRGQFSHVNDIAPTIYELTGAKFPEAVDSVKQIPLEGKSLVYSFDNANAPTRHTLQYFTTSGNRAIYKDGWWAGNRFHSTWEQNFYSNATDKDIDVHPWELYNLNEDFSQAHDLAAKNPEKLKELLKAFDEEATRNHAYPILPARSTPLDAKLKDKTVFLYRSGVERVPLRFAPGLIGHAYTIDADVIIPPDGAEGVIVAEGGELAGVSLYVKNERVYYEVNVANDHSEQLIASRTLRSGLQHIQLTVTPDAEALARTAPVGVPGFGARGPISGSVKLAINGTPAGESHFSGIYGAGETLDVGSDLGSAVSLEYKAPYRFTGKIESVKVSLQ
ncbi:MAG: arylsulfatase [Terracidiphilus sp.]|nr:arylsulfatase [Terracidiphilus sp.]